MASMSSTGSRGEPVRRWYALVIDSFEYLRRFCAYDALWLAAFLIAQGRQIKVRQIKAICVRCSLCPCTKAKGRAQKLSDLANGSSRLNNYFGTISTLKTSSRFIDCTGQNSLSPNSPVTLLAPILHFRGNNVLAF